MEGGRDSDQSRFFHRDRSEHGAWRSLGPDFSRGIAQIIIQHIIMPFCPLITNKRGYFFVTM